MRPTEQSPRCSLFKDQLLERAHSIFFVARRQLAEAELAQPGPLRSSMLCPLPSNEKEQVPVQGRPSIVGRPQSAASQNLKVATRRLECCRKHGICCCERVCRQPLGINCGIYRTEECWSGGRGRKKKSEEFFQLGCAYRTTGSCFRERTSLFQTWGLMETISRIWLAQSSTRTDRAWMGQPGWRHRTVSPVSTATLSCMMESSVGTEQAGCRVYVCVCCLGMAMILLIAASHFSWHDCGRIILH